MNLDQILLMRNDTTGLYFNFIDFYLSGIIGKMFYKENRCEKLLSEFSSISDEALAILIFENSKETWHDMVKNNSKKSMVTRKYTNGGSSSVKQGSSRRYQGWSHEGMEQFNVLFDLVKENRASPNAKLFEEEFKVFCENGGVSGKKKNVCSLLHKTITICHELWSDNGEDEKSESNIEGPPRKLAKLNEETTFNVNKNIDEENKKLTSGTNIGDEEDGEEDEASLPSNDEVGLTTARAGV